MDAWEELQNANPDVTWPASRQTETKESVMGMIDGPARTTKSSLGKKRFHFRLVAAGMAIVGLGGLAVNGYSGAESPNAADQPGTPAEDAEAPVDTLQPSGTDEPTEQTAEGTGLGDEEPRNMRGAEFFLAADSVSCVYTEGGGGFPAGEVFNTAPDGVPNDAPLTEEILIDECLHGTDASGISTTAVACAIGTDVGLIVAVGVEDCQRVEPNLRPATDADLDVINDLRRTEVVLRSIPRDCPTADEVLEWVNAKAAAVGVGVEVMVLPEPPPPPTLPGGGVEPEPEVNPCAEWNLQWGVKGDEVILTILG